jgi:aryl-alcohol dehydrogenase-like predicted oxidoreductase
MQTKPLGNSDMQITALGFGSWAIGGGDWAGGWGPQDDRQAIEAIERAVDLGMNWIDTAAVYGLGHSEELVGQALRGMRQKPYVFTKCVLRWDDQRQLYNSMKADSIRYECDASLRRLGVDVIDLYQIHWPDPDHGI